MSRKVFIFTFLNVVILFLPACSSLKISEENSERMVAVKSCGSPALYPVKLADGKVKKDYSYEQQLSSIFDAVSRSKRKKILIYVFGGMNTLDSTVERSESLSKIIYDQSDYYPIMINWESSLADSYFDHLFFIRRGMKSYTFGPVLFPFYLLVDIARAVTRLPINLAFQTQGFFAHGIWDKEFSMKDYEKIYKLKMKFYVGDDHEEDYRPLTRRLAYIFGFPFRVVSTALIDVGGKSAWDVMIRRSRIVFQKAQTFETDFSDEISVMTSPPDGAMSIFMNKLRKFILLNPDIEITLIGHSMGAFIINGMLGRYSNIHFRNIVYLAPACSCKDAAVVLRPYLKKHPKSTFYNLCIHPNRDANAMLAGGLLPRGSVLKWIDLYFSDPLTSNDHCLGIWLTAMYTMPRLLGSAQSQCVMKAFGINDPITNTILIDAPENHTDFSNPKLRFWEPDFWKIPIRYRNTKRCPFLERYTIK